MAGEGEHSATKLPPLPNYQGAGINNVVPSIFLHLARSRGSLFGKSQDEIEVLVHSINKGSTPDLGSWYPKDASGASQIVLLVLDGLGFSQFERFAAEMPNLNKFSTQRISSVAPTTTATALTSISTGATPATHGILGYRMKTPQGKIMNSLSWACPNSDSALMPSPDEVQPKQPFLDFHPKVVTKAQYQNSGFTRAHLRDTQIVDYRFPSTMVDHVSELLHKDEAFVYTYYEGIDTVAHEYGLRECYLEELKAVDYFIGRLVKSLPQGSTLLVTSDHGQVEVPGSPIVIDSRILSETELLSGEGRFRWLHLKSGSEKKVVNLALELYGNDAWVMTKSQLVEAGYYGSPAEMGLVGDRLGDVALIAKTNVAFFDPMDTGPYNLVSRHGSLTPDELEVPLLSFLSK